jgi:hypothetical protein
MSAVGIIIVVLAALGAIVNPLAFLATYGDEVAGLAVLGFCASVAMLTLGIIVLAIGG